MHHFRWIYFLLLIVIFYGIDESLTYDLPYDTLEVTLNHYRTLGTNSLPASSLESATKAVDVISSIQPYLDQSMIKYATVIADMDTKIRCNGMSMQQCVVNRLYASTGTFDMNNSIDVCQNSGVLCDDAGNITTLAIDAATHGLADQQNRSAFKYIHTGLCKSPDTNRGSWYYVLQVFAQRLALSLASSTPSSSPSPRAFVEPPQFPSPPSASSLPLSIQNIACKLNIGNQCARLTSTVAPCLTIDGFSDSSCSSPCFEDCRMSLSHIATSANNVFWGRSNVLFDGVTEAAFRVLDIMTAYGCQTISSSNDEDTALFSTYYPMDESDVDHTKISTQSTPTSGNNSKGNPLVLGAPEWLKRWYHFSIDSDAKSLRTQFGTYWKLYLRTFRDYDRFTLVEQFLCSSSSSNIASPAIDALSSTFGLFRSRTPPSWSFPSDWPSVSSFWDTNNNVITSNPLHLYICSLTPRSKADVAMLWKHLFFPSKPISDADKKVSKMFRDIWTKFINLLNSSLHDSHPKPSSSPPSPSVFQPQNNVGTTPGPSTASTSPPTESCKRGTSETIQCSAASIKPCKENGIVRPRCCEGKSGVMYICQSPNHPSPSLPTKNILTPSRLPPLYCFNASTESNIDCNSEASSITVCTDADKYFYKCCIVKGVIYNCSGTRYPPLLIATQKPSYPQPTPTMAPSRSPTLSPLFCYNKETQTKIDCNTTSSPITICTDADQYYFKCCVVNRVNYNCSGTRYPPLPTMTPKPSNPQPTSPVAPSRSPTLSPLFCYSIKTQTKIDCNAAASTITVCTDVDNHYYKCCIVEGVNYNCSGVRYPPLPSSSPSNPSGRPPMWCANNAGDKLDCSILKIDLCYDKDGSLYKCCKSPGTTSSIGSLVYFCGDPIYKALPSNNPASGFIPSITTVICKSISGLSKRCSKDSLRNCLDHDATPYFCCYDGSISFRCELPASGSGSKATGAPSLPSSFPTKSENAKDDPSTDIPSRPTIPATIPFICYSNNGNSITGTMTDIEVCQADPSTDMFPCIVDDFSNIYDCTSALIGQHPSTIPSSIPLPSSPPIVCVNNTLKTTMNCFPSDIYSCMNSNGNMSLCCKYQSVEYLCPNNQNPSSIPPTSSPAFIFVDTFLSPSLAYLKTLKLLRISGFNMSGPIFSDINYMASLKLVSLQNNRLASQMSVFKNMSLTSLNLDNNWIYGTLDGLSNVNGLTNIHLNNNLLFGGINKNLESVFSKFQICEMNDNNFACPNPSFIAKCINNISACVDSEKAIGPGLPNHPISAPDVCITLSTPLKVTISTTGSSVAEMSPPTTSKDDFILSSPSSFITINSSQRFSFIATIDSSITNSLKLPGSTSLPYAFYSYSWTICAMEATGINCPSDDILSDKSIFPAGFTSSGFVIDYQQALHKSVFNTPNSLTVSSKVTLKNPCLTTDASFLTASSKLNIKLSSPPFGGKCKVTPATGFVFTTVFTATCSKFQSSNGTIRTMIFSYSSSSSTLYVGSLSGADSGSISFKSTAIGSMTLSVTIYDSVGSSTTVSVPNAFSTTPQNPSNNNGTTFMSPTVKTTISNGLIDVMTASKGNNTSSVFTTSLWTSSLLNSVGTANDHAYSSNIREQLAHSVANALAKDRNNNSSQGKAESSSTAMCGAQALESLTEESKELTSNAIVVSSQALSNLITMLQDTTVNPSVAKSILNISSNIVNASSTSMSDNEQVSQTIQQNVTAAISALGRVLIKNAVPGESTMVTSSNVSLECFTGTVSSLSGNVSSKIILPSSFLTQSSIVGISDSNTVLSTVSLSWKTPIHNSSSSSTSVAGETVSFFLLSNDKEILLQNLTKKIRISMNLNNSKTGNETCGFFDEISNSYSTEGCSVSTDNGMLSNSILTCECNHATDYVPLLGATGSSQSSSSPASSSRSVNIELIIGCVVGAIALLSLVIIGIFLAIQRRQRQRDVVAPSTVTELPVINRPCRNNMTPTSIPSRLKGGIPVDTQGNAIFLEHGAKTYYDPNDYKFRDSDIPASPAYHRDYIDVVAENFEKDIIVETDSSGNHPVDIIV